MRSSSVSRYDIGKLNLLSSCGPRMPLVRESVHSRVDLHSPGLQDNYIEDVYQRRPRKRVKSSGTGSEPVIKIDQWRKRPMDAIIHYGLFDLTFKLIPRCNVGSSAPFHCCYSSSFAVSAIPIKFSTCRRQTDSCAGYPSANTCRELAHHVSVLDAFRAINFRRHWIKSSGKFLISSCDILTQINLVPFSRHRYSTLRSNSYLKAC